MTLKEKKRKAVRIHASFKNVFSLEHKLAVGFVPLKMNSGVISFDHISMIPFMPNKQKPLDHSYKKMSDFVSQNTYKVALDDSSFQLSAIGQF